MAHSFLRQLIVAIIGVLSATVFAHSASPYETYRNSVMEEFRQVKQLYPRLKASIDMQDQREFAVVGETFLRVIGKTHRGVFDFSSSPEIGFEEQQAISDCRQAIIEFKFSLVSITDAAEQLDDFVRDARSCEAFWSKRKAT